MKIDFYIKQFVKMIVQNCVLPMVYSCFRQRPIQKRSVIFADAHHSFRPFSMESIFEQVSKLDYEINTFFLDFSRASFIDLAVEILKFTKCYATAEYVFICDYYLPVSSCKKRSETTVVQLWHSGGLMKKIAYDTTDDIPSIYRGNLFRNYDLLTVSAKCCEDVLAKAMRLPIGVVKALGCNRTDRYFDDEYCMNCKKNFYENYPEAKNKKILLWAPTFRGNASTSQLPYYDEIKREANELNDEFFLVIKVHPHTDRKYKMSNCNISTEELLPVADLLITDYSSVLFDYILFEKPFVLLMPDLKKYEKDRGLYVDPHEFPGPLITDISELASAICRAFDNFDLKAIHFFRINYMGACDGKVTQRILSHINIK